VPGGGRARRIGKNVGHFGELERAYLPLPVGKGKPSNAHDTCGVGFPAAEHFKDTAGPGCSVCSMKEYSSTGGASEMLTRKTSLITRRGRNLCRER
jgi:hypothetical protein